MKRRLFNIIPYLLCLLPICLFAQTSKIAEQDITGLWKGSLYNDSTKKFLPYEIAISEEKGKLTGYSYTLFEDSGKKEIGVKRIKIKKKDGEIIIEDVEMISNNFSVAPPKKVKVQGVLALYVNDTTMEMRGRWSTNKTWEYSQLTGSLQVKRSLAFKQMALYEKLQELKLEKDLSFVKADIKTQADIASVGKPVVKSKMIAEVPAVPADVNKPGEINDLAEKNKDVAIENKPGKTAQKIIEAPIAKTAVETPKEITSTKTPEPLVKTAPVTTVKTEQKSIDAPIAKTAMETPKEIASTITPKPLVKTAPVTPVKTEQKSINAPIAKTAVEIPKEIGSIKTRESLTKNEPVRPGINPTEQPVATASTIEKAPSVATANPVKKTISPVLKDSISKTLKDREQSIAKTTVTEKPATIKTVLPAKKTTEQLAKDSVSNKTKPAEDLAIKPVTPIIQPTEKKKDIVAASTVKKEKVLPEIEQPETIVPQPAAKNTAPVVTMKAPVQKDNKAATDIAKKPLVNEKPAASITPPVVKVVEPIKPVTTTAIVTIPEEKTAMPIVATAPVLKAAADVAERKMKNQQSVFFESDSLVLTLYDNGEVDGDTVSVLMNGQIIFAKQGLTEKANTKTIHIDKSMTDSISMVMYAESLGSIPPNTGLLIIMDGEKRYEVRFSADLQTNAAILLRRKPKEQ